MRAATARVIRAVSAAVLGRASTCSCTHTAFVRAGRTGSVTHPLDPLQTEGSQLVLLQLLEGVVQHHCARLGALQPPVSPCSRCSSRSRSGAGTELTALDTMCAVGWALSCWGLGGSGVTCTHTVRLLHSGRDASRAVRTEKHRSSLSTRSAIGPTPTLPHHLTEHRQDLDHRWAAIPDRDALSGKHTRGVGSVSSSADLRPHWLHYVSGGRGARTVWEDARASVSSCG